MALTVKTTSDIAASMVQALAVTIPELDTAIGSPTRKILDAVAEQIAPAYSISHLFDYQFDLNAKSGEDLDDFCATFGIFRLPASRATGVVTFTRPAPADRDYPVPANTQVATRTDPRVIFATVSPATLTKTTQSVDVPVQALVGGESGNLPAGALVIMVSGTTGVSSTTVQSAPTTGGVGAESDEALRARFKQTVFRSLAGTEDMFRAVALEDSTPDNPSDTVATQVNVIGASKRWREQVQIVAGNAVSSINPANLKYVFQHSAIFGKDIDNAGILTEGIHYTFDTSVNPPEINSIGSALDNNAIYELDYEYSPTSSRNDPAVGITNRVDVWVNGVAPQEAEEITYFHGVAFTGLTTDPMWTDNFVRQDTNNVHPAALNLLMQLGFGPILTFPETLTIDTVVYTKGTDYWVVHEDTAFGYGPTSKFGLEWAVGSHPVTGTQIVLSGANSYTFNRIPRDVEARIRDWALVTMDARAHAAKQLYLRLNFAVMYSPSYNPVSVEAGVRSALATFLDGQGFTSVIQVSDIIQAAHEVSGVDNIRFLNSEEAFGDDDSYAMEWVTPAGDRIAYFDDGGAGVGTPKRARDIVLFENQVPVLYDINLAVKAQNSWGEPR